MKNNSEQELSIIEKDEVQQNNNDLDGDMEEMICSFTHKSSNQENILPE